uniref:Cytochrome b-c1 complex subunit 7 n=1 Tax=Cyclophora tenuis TaxID=216820 RepID=A0A7S1CYA1_CYCTE
MALRMMADKVFLNLSKTYQKSLAKDLMKLGLRYEDLMLESPMDMQETLELADKDFVTGRYRRQKRAFDLDVKHKNMLEYAPDVDQETYKQELYPLLCQIRARNQEIALLDQHKK